MATNRDFKDLFAALFEAEPEFIVVGAHAVMSTGQDGLVKEFEDHSSLHRLGVVVRVTPDREDFFWRTSKRRSPRARRSCGVAPSRARARGGHRRAGSA